MAMVVVAITLDTEARSKRVRGVAGGEVGSYVKRPKARRATRLPSCVTAMEAAGKAWATMASSTMRKALAKRWFWSS
jgi:hypothetical protein